ncbi:uncharacterized protein BDR25DRAFT_289012, partial [Lindgomyces ingoldianus]
MPNTAAFPSEHTLNSSVPLLSDYISSSPKNIYSPLPLGDTEIRLVTIVPGILEDPMVCILEAVSLDSPLAYEALSYVWGNLDDSRTIIVNNAPADVTSNLDMALRYIRHPEELRTMWIDAICIDQSNTVERNQQVRMMTSIYRRAHTVLIWVGILEEQETFSVLERINRRDAGQINHCGILATLILRDWFHRIWTKQELTVALRDPWIIFG